MRYLRNDCQKLPPKISCVNCFGLAQYHANSKIPILKRQLIYIYLPTQIRFPIRGKRVPRANSLGLGNNNNKNFRLARDQVMLLETAGNRPFSKMAAENSNKSKLKTYISTRKNTFTLEIPAKFQHFRCNIRN